MGRYIDIRSNHFFNENCIQFINLFFLPKKIAIQRTIAPNIDNIIGCKILISDFIRLVCKIQEVDLNLHLLLSYSYKLNHLPTELAL